jgi:hypothetical protein
MNTFSITFKNALGDIKTEEFNLHFRGVQAVANWFEDTLGIRAISISKH